MLGDQAARRRLSVLAAVVLAIVCVGALAVQAGDGPPTRPADQTVRTPSQPDSDGAPVQRAVDREPAEAPKGDPVPEALRQVADEFVDLARGQGPGPAWADSVDLYLGGRLQKSLTAQQASSPEEWRSCDTYAERSCPFSALDTLAEAPVAVQSRSSAFCLNVLAQLPSDLQPRDPGSYVVLRQSGSSCVDVATVEIWTDQRGAVRVVNLSLGSP